MNYRKVFYEQYFESQAGRNFDVETKYQHEFRQFEREILPFFPNNKNAHILDIGCGIGSLLAALKTHGFTNLKGIDISTQQVAIAHQLGIEEVEKADLVQYLQTHEGAFDVISGMDIIEHFSKDELVEVLLLVRKSLKDHGLIIFRTPNADALFSSLYIAGDFTHENQLNSYSARQVLINCGFDEINVQQSHRDTRHFLKNIAMDLVWLAAVFYSKLVIFASGRSSKNIVFTPNLLIKAQKSNQQIEKNTSNINQPKI